MHPLPKTVVIALFCGVTAFTATWIRRRQLSSHERTSGPAGFTPAWPGVTAIIGALLGIAVMQGWSAYGVG